MLELLARALELTSSGAREFLAYFLGLLLDYAWHLLAFARVQRLLGPAQALSRVALVASLAYLLGTALPLYCEWLPFSSSDVVRGPNPLIVPLLPLAVFAAALYALRCGWRVALALAGMAPPVTLLGYFIALLVAQALA